MPEATTHDAEPLSLTGLEVENVLRIKAVKLSLEPGGALIIEGRNEQGKSSILRSLEMLLAGMSETPDEPIHGDAKEGQIIATFGDIVVTKAFKRGRSPALSIHREGKRQTAPQTLLNDLLDRVSLDPLTFMQADDHERLMILSDVMGFDSAPYDLRHDQIYEKRRDANRDVKRLEIELDAAPLHEDAPDVEVSVAELTTELAKRRAHNDRIRDKHNEVAEAVSLARREADAVDSASEECGCVDEDMADMERKLAAMREILIEVKAEFETAKVAQSIADRAVDGIKAELSEMVSADEGEITAQMTGAEDANRKFRDNARRETLIAKTGQAKAVAATLDDDLNTCETERETARLAARERLPVPELDITRYAVLYRGKPLSQAGSSAQLRVSVAVALAVNKNKRVKILLVDDAEKLDGEGTEIVLRMAKDAGFQVFMARVIRENGDASQGSVLIEDGTVMEG